MKKIYLISLLLLWIPGIYAQSENKVNSSLENNEIQSRFNNRKEKGFYHIMQISFLFGTGRSPDRAPYSRIYSPVSSFAPTPAYYYSDTREALSVAPSFTLTNGYIFNKHWAAGAGMGFEIFENNLFPIFAELRYTLWDHKISPFWVVKGGYSIGNFKAKHHDELYLNWSPYFLSDAKLRHYGGLMLHPEVGIKVPLSENSDLLITAAYRYQEKNSEARKEYDNGEFGAWEHHENLNRLSFGVAILFR